MSFSVPIEAQTFHQQHPSGLVQAASHHAAHSTSHPIDHLYQQHQQRAVQTGQRAPHQPSAPFAAQHLHLSSPQPPSSFKSPTAPPQAARSQQHRVQCAAQDARGVFEIDQAHDAKVRARAPPPAATDHSLHRDYDARAVYSHNPGGASHSMAAASSIPQLLSIAKVEAPAAHRWAGQSGGGAFASSGASTGGARDTRTSARPYGDAPSRTLCGEGSGGASGGDAFAPTIITHPFFSSVNDGMGSSVALGAGVLTAAHMGVTRAAVLGGSGEGTSSSGATIGANAMHPSGVLSDTQAHHRMLQDRHRLRCVGPLLKEVSNDEKRERHNKHTKQSRKRIDDRIKELKEALKKVRPNVKLGHKAEIVGEAVKFVLEIYNLQQQNAQIVDSSLSN